MKATWVASSASSGVAQHEVGHPQGNALVGADEIRVGRDISVLGLFDQAIFIQWTALHRSVHLRYTATIRKVPWNHGHRPV